MHKILYIFVGFARIMSFYCGLTRMSIIVYTSLKSTNTAQSENCAVQNYDLNLAFYTSMITGRIMGFRLVRLSRKEERSFLMVFLMVDQSEIRLQ